MKKFHIHINAESNDDLKIELAEAAYILTGLSDAINKFDKEHGSDLAKRKAFWKDKAANWIAKNKMVYEESSEGSAGN